MMRVRNIGERYVVFKPTHGSASKYAGRYKVNPTTIVPVAKLRGERVRTHGMNRSNCMHEAALGIVKDL